MKKRQLYDKKTGEDFMPVSHTKAVLTPTGETAEARNTRQMEAVKGTGVSASAAQFPFMSLGDAGSIDEVNSILNNAYTSKDTKYQGRLRIRRNGQVVWVDQILLNSLKGYWMQVLYGPYAPSSNGSAVAVDAQTFHILYRYRGTGVSRPWRDITHQMSIKTVNGQSLIGEGNIVISEAQQISIDTELDTSSNNAVANSAVAGRILALEDDVEDVTTDFDYFIGGYERGLRKIDGVLPDDTTYTPESGTYDGDGGSLLYDKSRKDVVLRIRVNDDYLYYTRWDAGSDGRLKTGYYRTLDNIFYYSKTDGIHFLWLKDEEYLRELHPGADATQFAALKDRVDATETLDGGMVRILPITGLLQDGTTYQPDVHTYEGSDGELYFDVDNNRTVLAVSNELDPTAPPTYYVAWVATDTGRPSSEAYTQGNRIYAFLDNEGIHMGVCDEGQWREIKDNAAPTITADSVLDGRSMRPVQNKVIKAAIDSTNNDVTSLAYRVTEMEGINSTTRLMQFDGTAPYPGDRIPIAVIANTTYTEAGGDILYDANNGSPRMLLRVSGSSVPRYYTSWNDNGRSPSWAYNDQRGDSPTGLMRDDIMLWRIIGDNLHIYRIDSGTFKEVTFNVDNELDSTSTNPVQNMVVAARINEHSARLNTIETALPSVRGCKVLPIDGVMPTGTVVLLEDGTYEEEGGELMLVPSSSRVVLAVNVDDGEEIATLYYGQWNDAGGRLPYDVYDLTDPTNILFAWISGDSLHFGKLSGETVIEIASGTAPQITIDTALNRTSANPVQNAVITSTINNLITTLNSQNERITRMENSATKVVWTIQVWGEDETVYENWSVDDLWWDSAEAELKRCVEAYVPNEPRFVEIEPSTGTLYYLSPEDKWCVWNGEGFDELQREELVISSSTL